MLVWGRGTRLIGIRRHATTVEPALAKDPAPTTLTS